MPPKQMGIAVESQKTMYVHQVWMLVAGFPVSDVLTIKCLEFFASVVTEMPTLLLNGVWNFRLVCLYIIGNFLWMLDLEGTWNKKVSSEGNSSNNFPQP